MRHIDYVFGAFQRKALEALPAEAKCDFATVYRGLLAAGWLASQEVHERFNEIGSSDDLREAANSPSRQTVPGTQLR